MSSNVVRAYEMDDYVIYEHQNYNINTIKRCKNIFDIYIQEGKLEGNFYNDVWHVFSGTSTTRLSFEIDAQLYEKHFKTIVGVPYSEIKQMIKCYAIILFESHIFSGIRETVLSTIINFVENYSESKVKYEYESLAYIEEFLYFIDVPHNQIEHMIRTLKVIKHAPKGQRKLKPVINYLALSDAINNLYESEMNADDFIIWFPIYFWVNITFILPLRATEMLVTPLDCIYQKGTKTFLRVRRTTLKGSKNKTVFHEIARDYKIFQYEVPETPVILNIKKYIRLTRNIKRELLFVPSKYAVSDIYTLGAFNALIARFMGRYVIDNKKYEFAKYASNIQAFEAVTAGDSRPIAMANLYFQKISADTCRQLADHETINTSCHYYTNVSETIIAASIIRFQKRLNKNRNEYSDQIKFSNNIAVSGKKGICLSPRRQIDQEDIQDCLEQKHLFDCIGCPYYRPSHDEIDELLKEKKDVTNQSTVELIKALNEWKSTDVMTQKVDQMLIKAQTDIMSYKLLCDEKVKEVAEEWQKHKNI